jgi:DNA-binding HxlR family transcriptional regulator
MKRTALGHHPCSIARTLDIVGEWWTPLILRDIAYGIRRFGEIQEDLEISANILADRLDALRAHGLLEARTYQQRPERQEYHLTEKGVELIPALLALMQWGDRWTWPNGSGPVRVVHEQCEHEVHLEIGCPHCERGVAVHELRAKPRHALPPSHFADEKQSDEQRPKGPGGVSGRRLYAAEHGVPLGA